MCVYMFREYGREESREEKREEQKRGKRRRRRYPLKKNPKEFLHLPWSAVEQVSYLKVGAFAAVGKGNPDSTTGTSIMMRLFLAGRRLR